ncbi:hypothetical protein DK316_21875, partial [Mycobacterium tuberculosis]
MTGTKTTEDVDRSGGEPHAARAAGHHEAPDKPAWWVRHYTFFGTATGLVFIWLSLTPSLLPRGPLFQGLVS